MTLIHVFSLFDLNYIFMSYVWSTFKRLFPQVMEAFRKIQTARQKKKTPTKKEKDGAMRALKDRQEVVRQLEDLDWTRLNLTESKILSESKILTESEWTWLSLVSGLSLRSCLWVWQNEYRLNVVIYMGQY